MLEFGGPLDEARASAASISARLRKCLGWRGWSVGPSSDRTLGGRRGQEGGDQPGELIDEELDLARLQDQGR